jgi:WD40 repeat protein
MTNSRSIDDIIAEVETKLVLGNPDVEQTALTIARDSPGQYNINQVSKIYDALIEGWYYYSDPSYREKYKNANQTLLDGKRSASVGMGDCDDFAILMASLIESLGGNTRITFAYNGREGHAYAEIYLGKKNDTYVDDLLDWLKSEYNQANITGVNTTNDDIWLNLDYNSSYPGGPYFGEGNGSIQRMVVWQSSDRVSPEIIPIIDTMDSPSRWKIIKDNLGSDAIISSTPARKGRGNAINISFNIKENGWVGIAREIDPAMLSSINGLNFSCFGMDKMNTIQLRLNYDDKTQFGSSWKPMKQTDKWWSLQGLLKDFECLDNDSKCADEGNRVNLSIVKELEIIVSNKPYEGDEAGQGSLVVDHIVGVMNVPPGSPWEQAEKEKLKAKAIYLAGESENLQEQPEDFNLGVLLAVESLKHSSTLQGKSALFHGLSLLPKPLAGFAHNVDLAAISFSPNNRYLATASEDIARIWEISTGKELGRMVHNGSVNDLCFSPDGKMLATASDDQTARLWNISTLSELVKLQHNDSVKSVAFSPDGNKIVAASTDGTARIWNASTGQELIKVEHNHSTNLRYASFSPSGNQFIAIDAEDYAGLWNTSTGKELVFAKQHLAFRAPFSFSPDGRHLAATENEAVRVWDLITGSKLARMESDGSIISMSFSPDGTRLATGSTDETARIWDATTGVEMIRMKLGGDVSSVTFSPDGKMLATACEFRGGGLRTAIRDKTARIWDAATGEELLRIGYDDWNSNEMAFSPDGKMLATASRDGKVSIWSSRVAGVEQACYIPAVVFSPDWKNMQNYSVVYFGLNSTLKAAMKGNTVTIWNLSSGAEISRMEHDSEVQHAMFSPDGTRLATITQFHASSGGKDGGIARIWDVATGSELVGIKQKDLFQDLAFGPEGDYLVTGGFGPISIWDMANGFEQMRIEQDEIIYSLCLSPDGSRLATGDNEGNLRIWDIDSGTELNLKKMKHDGWINSVAFSSNGKLLASASADKTARIWDASTGEEITRIEHNDTVISVCFSPDDTRLATVSDDKTRVYQLNNQDLINETCCRLTKSLMPEEWNEYLGDEPYQDACSGDKCPDRNFVELQPENSIDYNSIDFDYLRKEIREKMELGDPRIANTAMVVLTEYPGAFTINQISQIYNALTGCNGWHYDSDLHRRFDFQNASVTLQGGYANNVIGSGDRDDFAVLIASLLESIGGSTRITLINHNHIYVEVYLGRTGDSNVTNIIQWLEKEYDVDEISGVNMTGEEIWLNLDWGIGHPGGHYSKEGNPQTKRIILWESKDKIPPRIIPIIDNMDSVYGWETSSDAKGSVSEIEMVSGRKGPDIQISYNLKKNGWIGISKVINPEILLGTNGLYFSCFCTGGHNSLELRLKYDDGTTFVADCKNVNQDVWSTHRKYYIDFDCLFPTKKCVACRNQLDMHRVHKMEFIVLNNFNEAGSGKIVLSDVLGAIDNPRCFRPTEVEELQNESLAIHLASLSEMLMKNSSELETSILLAIESFKTNETIEGDQAIRQSINRMPRLIGVMENSSFNFLTPLTFSPDGMRVAATNYGVARIWNTSSSQLMANILHPAGQITSSAFSPKGDRFATSGTDGTAVIWDAATGRELMSVHQTGTIYSLTFNGNGTLLATAGDDKAARIYDSATGRELLRIDHDNKVYLVTILPDESRLITASMNDATEETEIGVWNLNERREMSRTKYDIDVHSVTFSSNKTHLKTAGNAKTANIWDVTNGMELAMINSSQWNSDQYIDFVAFSSDEKLLATLSFDGAVRIRAIATDEVIAVLNHKSTVRYMAFSPDGTQLATASSDRVVRLWDIKSGKEVVEIYCDSNTMTFSPNGMKLATVGDDIKLWDIQLRGDKFSIVDPEDYVGYQDLFPTQKGVFYLSGDSQNRDNNAAIKVWDVVSGMEIARISGINMSNNDIFWSSDESISTDGTCLATSGNFGIQLWNLTTGREIEKIIDLGPVSRFDLSSNGSRLVAIGPNNTSIIWNVLAGKEVAKKWHGQAINSVIFSPNGDRIAAIKGNITEIWDASDGKELSILEHNGHVNSVAFNLDASRVATASDDKTARIWDISTGKELRRIKHDDSVTSAAISPDGTKIATASFYAARVWDASSGRMLAKIACDYEISSIAFTLDGLKLVTGSWSSATAWIWSTQDLIADVCSDLSRKNLTQEEWLQYLGRRPYHSTCTSCD